MKARDPAKLASIGAQIPNGCWARLQRFQPGFHNLSFALHRGFGVVCFIVIAGPGRVRRTPFLLADARLQTVDKAEHAEFAHASGAAAIDRPPFKALLGFSMEMYMG